MARTPGATNKTPRELRTEAKYLNKMADYKEKITKLKSEAKKK